MRQLRMNLFGGFVADAADCAFAVVRHCLGQRNLRREELEYVCEVFRALPPLGYDGQVVRAGSYSLKHVLGVVRFGTELWRSRPEAIQEGDADGKLADQLCECALAMDTDCDPKKVALCGTGENSLQA